MDYDKQKEICNFRDEISSIRGQMSDLENELTVARKNWEDSIVNCSHTYEYSYECRLNGTSAIDNGRCYICQDVF